MLSENEKLIISLVDSLDVLSETAGGTGLVELLNKNLAGYFTTGLIYSVEAFVSGEMDRELFITNLKAFKQPSQNITPDAEIVKILLRAISLTGTLNPLFLNF